MEANLFLQLNFKGGINMTGAAILAAGYGYMREGRSKLGEPIADQKVIIQQVVDNVHRVGNIHPIVVVINSRYGAELKGSLEQAGHRNLKFVHQPDRHGPADALHRCLQVFREHFASDALVVFGDMPLLKPELMRDMVRVHENRLEEEQRRASDLTISSWTYDPKHPLASLMRNYAFLLRGRSNGDEGTPILRMYSGESPSAGADILSSLYVVRLGWFENMFPQIVPVAKDQGAPERHMPSLIDLAIVNNSRVNNLYRGVTPEQIVGVDAHTPESLEIVRRLYAERYIQRS